MELKRTITLKFDYDEWQKLIDVANLLRNLGGEMQKLDEKKNVILDCNDCGDGAGFKIHDIFSIADEIELIADGGTINI